MNKSLLLKSISLILILVIFYCVCKNYNVLREGLDTPQAKCKNIKNCKDCGTKVTSDDGVCYWCNGKCKSGANYSKYAAGSCSRDVNNTTCTAIDTVTPATTSTTTSATTTYPGYPILVDIPAGTKMSQQYKPL
jgi:hypothetical protein